MDTKPKYVRKSTAKKKKIFIEAFNLSHGVIQPALDAADIHRTTYHSWMKKDEKFAKAVNEAGEAAIEFVESKMYENVALGKERSVIYYLKVRSDKYKEKTQIDQNVTVNEPVKITIIQPEKK